MDSQHIAETTTARAAVRTELCASRADFAQVLALSRINHSRVLEPALWAAHGFVTMEYTLDQLEAMAGPYRHVVAKDGDVVVGYALVMLAERKGPFTILHEMFDKIATASIDGAPIRDGDYFVMGQVCVAEAYRGTGVFAALYHGMRAQMREHFKLVITEVSDKNARSMGAHLALGFRDITPADPTPSEWHVVAWDWRDRPAR